jgi:hypothetical protein
MLDSIADGVAESEHDDNSSNEEEQAKELDNEWFVVCV